MSKKQIKVDRIFVLSDRQINDFYMSKIDKDGTENREALIIKRGKNMILLNSSISKQLVRALKEAYPDIILEIKIL